MTDLLDENLNLTINRRIGEKTINIMYDKAGAEIELFDGGGQAHWIFRVSGKIAE